MVLVSCVLRVPHIEKDSNSNEFGDARDLQSESTSDDIGKHGLSFQTFSISIVCFSCMHLSLSGDSIVLVVFFRIICHIYFSRIN